MFSGIQRTASDIADSYASTLANRPQEQYAMIKLAEEGVVAIYDRDWEKLGNLVDQSWRIKSHLSDKVSNEEITKAYATARIYGAFGGKIMGSGGGGCMMLIAPKEKHEKIISELPNFIPISFHFDFDGSKIIFADKDEIRCKIS